MEIGKLRLKCKHCGNIIGTLEDLFKFGSWINAKDSTKTEKEHKKWVLEQANQKDGLGFLTHIHITCPCEEWGEGMLKLNLDEDSDFEVVE